MIFITCGIAWAVAVPALAVADEEVEVVIKGDEVVERAKGGDEVEVTFEEEVGREELGGLPPLPRYRYSRWLLLLPIFGILICAWNVRWRRVRKVPFVPTAIRPPAPVETSVEAPTERTGTGS